VENGVAIYFDEDLFRRKCNPSSQEYDASINLDQLAEHLFTVHSQWANRDVILSAITTLAAAQGWKHTICRTVNIMCDKYEYRVSKTKSQDTHGVLGQSCTFRLVLKPTYVVNEVQSEDRSNKRKYIPDWSQLLTISKGCCKHGGICTPGRNVVTKRAARSSISINQTKEGQNNNSKRKATDLPTDWTNIPPRKGGKRRRRFDELFSSLPRSANVIDSNSMISDLPDEMKQHLRAYIIDRCPGSAEIADMLFWIAEQFPQHLRTKELCETLESVTLIGADINSLLSKNNDPTGSRKKNMTIFDLACGHALGGLLLGYRFSFVKVICIDKEERPCWSSYRAAFEKFGKKANKNDTIVTSNVSFVVGDITSECFQPQSGDYIMCLHGCNELSPFVLSKAQSTITGFAIMPCCLRDGMLGVTTTSSNNNWGIVDDTARYSIQVGYLAGKFGVGKIAAISQLITNRFLMLTGDFRNGVTDSLMIKLSTSLLLLQHSIP
jgi:hypothetical protein